MKKLFSIAISLLLTTSFSFTMCNKETHDANFFFKQGMDKIMPMKLSRDFQGATVDFDKAIELNPKFAEAFNKRGYAKIQLNDHQGAILDFDKALDYGLTTEKAETYYYRGIAKNILKDYRSAIDDFSKSINLKQNAPLGNASSYYNRGYAKIKLKDYHGALRDFDNALNSGIPSEQDKTYYFRGLAKLQLSKHESGCKDLIKADELGYTEAYDAIKKHCK
ncbi:MAG: hypothetical protein V1874_17825 [Spirochaetota bacterium]